MPRTAVTRNPDIARKSWLLLITPRPYPHTHTHPHMHTHPHSRPHLAPLPTTRPCTRRPLSRASVPPISTKWLVVDVGRASPVRCAPHPKPPPLSVLPSPVHPSGPCPAPSALDMSLQDCAMIIVLFWCTGSLFRLLLSFSWDR